MSRVFVVQRQQRWDDRKQELVDRFDTLDLAKKHGEFIYLLSPKAGPFNPDSVIAELHEKLKDYSDDDYLLLIGNPCLIGWTVAIAAHYNGGVVNLLQWNGSQKDYIMIASQIA